MREGEFHDGRMGEMEDGIRDRYSQRSMRGGGRLMVEGGHCWPGRCAGLLFVVSSAWWVYDRFGMGSMTLEGLDAVAAV